MAFLLVASLAIEVPYAYSEKTNDFFPKDSALTVFDSAITRSDDPHLELLRPLEEKEQAVAPDAPVAKNEVSIPEQPLSAETVLAKYGDPSKDAPVLAQDNAPAPFKAMMAALEVGDDTLALGYARQYVRHLRNVNQRAKKAMAIQGFAMQKEGMLGSNDWPSSKSFDEERLIYEEQLKETEKIADGKEFKNLSKLDSKAKDFLSKAAEMEGMVERLPNGEIIEEEPRMKSTPSVPAKLSLIPKEVRSRIPVDKKGEIDLYFFLRPKDQASIEMGKVYNQLYRELKTDPKVKFVGLTMEKEGAETVQLYRNQTGAAFPIVNGSVFSGQLGVESVPSLIAVSRNSGKAVQENGVRGVDYLKEVIAVMQGVTK